MTLIIFFNIFMLLTLNSVNVVDTLNILGVFPLPTKSHFFVFSPYLKELANRGHNVTVISYYPHKEPMVNYHDIDLGETAQATEISYPINKSLFMDFISTTIFQAFSGPLTCKILFENENVQNLWEAHVNFDLVIVEQFNSDCGLALAHALGAPVIGITSHVLLPWHYNRFGVPYNPSYVPFDFVDTGTKSNFMQRLTRYFFYNQINIIYTYVTQVIEQSIVQEFLSDTPPLSHLAKDIKLVLVYQNFVFFGSSISPPNVIEVGGFHVAEPRPLPDDLKKFIEESEYGVIYISFGTILKASSMSTDKLQSIINALNELPQRVIWKWNKKSLPGNPKNIYLAKWLPQNDILAHPKVMAFFSHCGLLGTTEALHHGVPVVGMPIYGDQPTNAAAIEESGLGVQVQLDLITKEYILDKFKIVLDPAFREKVKQLSKAWNDHPIKPMDKAIFWTEYAARYKNFTIRPPTVDVPLYQYLCLDTYSVIFITVVASIVTLKYIMSILYNNFVRKQYHSPGAKKTKVN